MTSPAEIEQKESGDVRRVVLVQRGGTRSFRNVTTLKRVIESSGPERASGLTLKVDVIDFEGLSIREQIEALTNPSPLFIIAAHGAGQTNLMYLDKETAANTNIIEICPPYTHCQCTDSVHTGFCPFFFYETTAMLNVSRYGYAVEDEQVDCRHYCDGNRMHNPHFEARTKVRDMKFVTVSARTLRDMMFGILESPMPPKGNITGRIWTHKMDLGEDVRGKFADMRTSNGKIQPPDVTDW